MDTDLTGKILIALPGIRDPRFQRAVILLCAHSPDFPMGIVLNKPMVGLRLPQLLEQLDVEIDGDGVVEVLDGAVRRTLGQLAGSSSARFTNGAESTPDRASCSWLVRAAPGTTVSVTVQHQRAGSDSVELVLEPG